MRSSLRTRLRTRMLVLVAQPLAVLVFAMNIDGSECVRMDVNNNRGVEWPPRLALRQWCLFSVFFLLLCIMHMVSNTQKYGQCEITPLASQLKLLPGLNICSG